MRRTLSIVLGTILAVTIAGPASAADNQYPGIVGVVTLWDDTNYADTSQIYIRSFDDLHRQGFNDKASSVVNKTDEYWLLHDDTQYRDRAVCIRPHSHYSRLANANFNDKTSSMRRGDTGLSSCNGWPIIGVFN